MATHEPCSFSPGLYKCSASKPGNSFNLSILGLVSLSGFLLQDAATRLIKRTDKRNFDIAVSQVIETR
jgi:hypothetical protein